MKISGLNKNIPAVLLFLVITSYVTQTCHGQKERVSRWDLDGDFEALKNYEALKNFDSDVPPERTLCSTNSGDDCDEERENIIYNMQLWKRQPAHAAVTSAFTANKGDKTIRTVPVFQSSQTRRCSCEMEHSMIDLGMLYYPRYVQSLVCKPGGCHGGHQCHPKKYKVRVLKQKQPEDFERAESNPAGLPEVLKELFVSDTISVIVACECAP